MNVIKNDLGGDMPQERLDRIKAAWMERYGMPESAWTDFSPVTTPVEYNKSIDESELEHPLCPSWEEMGLRYKAKSDFHRKQYAKLGDTVAGYQHLSDAEFYADLSKSCMEKHVNILRKVNGCR